MNQKILEETIESKVTSIRVRLISRLCLVIDLLSFWYSYVRYDSSQEYQLSEVLDAFDTFKSTYDIIKDINGQDDSIEIIIEYIEEMIRTEGNHI